MSEANIRDGGYSDGLARGPATSTDYARGSRSVDEAYLGSHELSTRAGFNTAPNDPVAHRLKQELGLDLIRKAEAAGLDIASLRAEAERQARSLEKELLLK
eukprot:SAG31_NODE_83_length_27039_cov_14.035746_7_plen_101_part_00